MGNFNNRNRSGGGGFRNRDSGGGRGGGSREMHQAVCSECGNDCEVPFRPSGNKPVFCSSCFDKQDGGSSRGRKSFGGGRPERSGNSNKEVLDQIAKLNQKLDAVLELVKNNVEKPKAKSRKAKSVDVKPTDLVEEVVEDNSTQE